MKIKNLALFAAAALFAVLLSVSSSAQNTVSVSIEAMNLSFSDSVYIKYAVSAEGLEDTDEVSLLIWTEPDESYEFGSHDYVLTSNVTTELFDKECRIFDFKSLAAKQMTDNVYARAYAEIDGDVYYSSVEKYSILQYAYNKLGKTGDSEGSENLKLLLADMLDYGTSAQIYFEYKTDRMANDDYYQIKVVGGALSDKSSVGLFLENENVTMYAGEKSGLVFDHWENADGETVGVAKDLDVIVANKNEIYTAVYFEPVIVASSESKFDESTEKYYRAYTVFSAKDGNTYSDVAGKKTGDEPVTAASSFGLYKSTNGIVLDTQESIVDLLNVTALPKVSAYDAGLKTVVLGETTYKFENAVLTKLTIYEDETISDTFGLAEYSALDISGGKNVSAYVVKASDENELEMIVIVNFVKKSSAKEDDDDGGWSDIYKPKK